MDHIITNFKFSGHIYIWKFNSENRNYPGWNLTTDTEGCNCFLNLLDLMSKSEFSSQKTLNTTQPSEKIVSVVNAGSKIKTRQNLILKFKKEVDDYWLIDDTPPNLLLQFSGEYIENLKRSILKIKNGDGDFAISDGKDENILYFWWLLK